MGGVGLPAIHMINHSLQCPMSSRSNQEIRRCIHIHHSITKGMGPHSDNSTFLVFTKMTNFKTKLASKYPKWIWPFFYWKVGNLLRGSGIWIFSFEHVCQWGCTTDIACVLNPKWHQWMSSSAKELTLSLVDWKKTALNDWRVFEGKKSFVIP